MMRVRQLRIGEGLAAAVRAEIDQLDLGRVYSCSYDSDGRSLALEVTRSSHVRRYPVDPASFEAISARLRAYARVRNVVRSVRSRTAA
jgi:hypothetical protein